MGVLLTVGFMVLEYRIWVYIDCWVNANGMPYMGVL